MLDCCLYHLNNQGEDLRTNPDRRKSSVVKSELKDNRAQVIGQRTIKDN